MKELYCKLILFVVLTLTVSSISSCTGDSNSGIGKAGPASATNAEAGRAPKKPSAYPPIASAVAQADMKNLDGTTFKVADRQGKVLLLNMWATWCGPCRSEFPELVQIDADYRAKNLKFFIVSVDDFSVIDTRVPEFLKDYESTMPSYLINIEGRKEIAKAVRQIAPRFSDVYPLTLLFDGRGKLVFQKIGRVNTKILRKEIDKVLPKGDE